MITMRLIMKSFAISFYSNDLNRVCFSHGSLVLKSFPSAFFNMKQWYLEIALSRYLLMLFSGVATWWTIPPQFFWSRPLNYVSLKKLKKIKSKNRSFYISEREVWGGQYSDRPPQLFRAGNATDGIAMLTNLWS